MKDPIRVVCICLAGLIAMLVAAVFGLAITAALHTDYNKTFTVTGKETVTSNKSSKYLVFTDSTTMEVTDSLVKWRFDSSGVYGKIRIGATYNADLQGYRIPFFSMYQNIINPKEVIER